MFSHIKSLLLIFIASLGLVACSSTSLSNLPIENITTTLTDKYTAEQVKSAIETAGEGRKWTMTSKGEGVIEAVYQRKGHRAQAAAKHQVTIKITYDERSYRISYVSSINMNEKVDSRGNISLNHNYMRWIENLNHDIQVQLLRVG